MVAKKPTRRTKRPSVAVEEKEMIERETFDWGIRLTAHPFKGTGNDMMVIRSEVALFKPGRGCEVRITFPAASTQNPLRLLDAQTWAAAMAAIVEQTRAVQAELRPAAKRAATKKR
jgi:hypothetical protein